MSAQNIWNYLMAFIGNEYGVAALMGNLKAESNLQSNNVENGRGYSDEAYTSGVNNGSISRSTFVNDRRGYGLAQWTSSDRKANLYNLTVARGVSVASEQAQCQLLNNELSGPFRDVLSVLKTATSIRQASDVVLRKFENPKKQGPDVQSYRASLGQGIYNQFHGTGGGGVDPGPEPPYIPPVPSDKAITSRLIIMIKESHWWRGGVW